MKKRYFRATQAAVEMESYLSDVIPCNSWREKTGDDCLTFPPLHIIMEREVERCVPRLTEGGRGRSARDYGDIYESGEHLVPGSDKF